LSAEVGKKLRVIVIPTERERSLNLSSNISLF
jgi:tRNA(Leu) C34 or U34 (ribose-2'-O)-methylase TrmL